MSLGHVESHPRKACVTSTPTDGALHSAAELEGRTLLVTGPVSDGFWVRVIAVLVHARWAERNGLAVNVRYRSTRDNYFAGDEGTADDGWTRYFDPIGTAIKDYVQLSCQAGARAWEQWGQYAATPSRALERSGCLTTAEAVLLWLGLS